MRGLLLFRLSRPGVRRTAPLLVATVLLAACGSEPGAGSASVDGSLTTDLVTDLFLERALAIESCTHMSGSQRLRVEFAATASCPTSGRRCCLASDPPAPCPGDPDRLCGTGGRFLSEHGVILLPDECDVAFEHELIHALLFVNERSGWRDHAHPAFTCATPGEDRDSRPVAR